MRSFGNRMKDIRTRAGMTQKECADKMGLAQPNLSDLEKSVHPPLNRIEQFCQIFNMELFEFFIDDPGQLKNYLPSYITKDDAEILKILNTRIEPAIRVSIKRSFVEIMKTALLSAGIPLEGALGK